jgi:hypothetical protein
MHYKFISHKFSFFASFPRAHIRNVDFVPILLRLEYVLAFIFNIYVILNLNIYDSFATVIFVQTLKNEDTKRSCSFALGYLKAKSLCSAFQPGVHLKFLQLMEPVPPRLGLISLQKTDKISYDRSVMKWAEASHSKHIIFSFY